MTSRTKDALALIARLEAKMREQQREMENLRVSVLHELATAREQYQPMGYAADREARCVRCHGGFTPGEHYIEYLDDDGQAVALYHRQCAGTL